MNLYFFKNQLEIPAAMVDIILRARVSMEEWLFKMNQNSRLDSETRKKKKKKEERDHLHALRVCTSFLFKYLHGNLSTIPFSNLIHSLL
jgi:hypothetical protein